MRLPRRMRWVVLPILVAVGPMVSAEGTKLALQERAPAEFLKAAKLASGQPAASLLAEESVGDDRCKEIEDVLAQWKSFGLASAVLRIKANGTPAQCGNE